MKLNASALACERNGRVVFSGVDFVVKSGELAELRGPNGSGKSSLLRQVAGLVPVSGGGLTLDMGDDDSAGDQPLPQRCHYVGHQDALKPSLTVRQNLSFWAMLLGGGDGDVERALAAFGLQALSEVAVQFLSAGQRRRLALARLPVAPRPIWLLDEPTTALDQTAEKTLGRMMDAHLASGGMVLAATHATLPRKADHVITLGNGDSEIRRLQI